VPEGSRWQLILSSDDEQFGGEGTALPAVLAAQPLSAAAAAQSEKTDASAPFVSPLPQEICGQPAAVSIDLPPCCAAIYKRIYK